MPLQDIVNPRDEIEKLIRSRSALKGTVTRHKSKAKSLLSTFQEGEDPTHLELIMKKWESALTKYALAEEAVIAESMADPKDSDEHDLGDNEDHFMAFQCQVIGLRRDYDKSEEPLLTPPADNNGIGQDGTSFTQRNLPRLSVNPPQTLPEDVDLQLFLKWKPTWDNYARLMSLPSRSQSTQISVFWQCCSPGFFRIVEHSVGIKADTGRNVDEVIAAITTHLRSLRNRHVDMKEFLSIKQKEGQDYTSICNEIKEYGEYADTANVTEDQLHIGILVQAMHNERDRAKLMADNPKTFEDARRFILSLETARIGAKLITPSDFRVQGNAITPTNKIYDGLANEHQDFSTGKCFACNGPRHPKQQCQAKNSICASCHRRGHYTQLCRNSPIKEHNG